MPSIPEEVQGLSEKLEAQQELEASCLGNPMDDSEVERSELERQEEVTKGRATTKATRADDFEVERPELERQEEVTEGRATTKATRADDAGVERPELESQEEVTEVRVTTKATKADDTGVAVEKWDELLVKGLGLELNERTKKSVRVLRD
jgi:hypothetical protein